MKYISLIISLLLVGVLHASDASYTLTVEVSGLRNNKGEVQFSLYNKDGTIPDKKQNQYFLKKRMEIKNGRATVSFENLPKGRYAISVFHDENNNGKIDKGMLTPKEGVGLSNFKTINLFNLPNFKTASFNFSGNMQKKIKTIYF